MSRYGVTTYDGPPPCQPCVAWFEDRAEAVSWAAERGLYVWDLEEGRITWRPSGEQAQRGVCGTCRFWLALDSMPTHGWCKRYPPTVMQANGQPVGGAIPQTWEQDWCGEWRWGARPVE